MVLTSLILLISSRTHHLIQLCEMLLILISYPYHKLNKIYVVEKSINAYICLTMYNQGVTMAYLKKSKNRIGKIYYSSQIKSSEWGARPLTISLKTTDYKTAMQKARRS